MIRAFIAVEIDLLNKQKLSELITSLKKSDADVKWANETQMHLTLKFLGNINENKVGEISDALKSAVKDFDSFTINLSKMGAFPDLRKPRVIWIGIGKGAEELKSLAHKVGNEMGRLGFAKEKRDFEPHLTLGRVRSLKNMPLLTNSLEKTRFEARGETRIDTIILFQSALTPKGAIYTALAEHTLSK